MEDLLKKQISKLDSNSSENTKMLFIIHFLSKNNIINEEVKGKMKLKIIQSKDNYKELNEIFSLDDLNNISIEDIKNKIENALNPQNNFSKTESQRSINKSKREKEQKAEEDSKESDLGLSFVKRKNKVRNNTSYSKSNEDSKEMEPEQNENTKEKPNEKKSPFSITLNFNNEDQKEEEKEDPKEESKEDNAGLTFVTKKRKKGKTVDVYKGKKTYITKALDNLSKL
ncbi:MAG: hypothetical protein MJ252_03840 [archaeon]|nr:hypothetical protein [archaeon]